MALGRTEITLEIGRRARFEVVDLKQRVLEKCMGVAVMCASER